MLHVTRQAHGIGLHTRAQRIFVYDIWVSRKKAE